MKARLAFICLAQILLLSCAQSTPVMTAVDMGHSRSNCISNVNPSEPEKIEMLISSIADMKDAEFIRKGTAYDCSTAARFMRGKWNWKSSEIRTARDFIRVCSAGGSGNGDPYYIRYKDGTQITSKSFLSEQLDRLDTTPARPAP